jgi:hypothetical protein
MRTTQSACQAVGTYLLLVLIQVFIVTGVLGLGFQGFGGGFMDIAIRLIECSWPTKKCTDSGGGGRKIGIGSIWDAPEEIAFGSTWDDLGL